MMPNLLIPALLGLGVALGLLTLLFVRGARRAGERTAARRALLGGLPPALLLCAGPLLPPLLQVWLLAVPAAVLSALAILLALPLGRLRVERETPAARYDERDICFSRLRLQPGTPAYRSYYRGRPDQEAGDNRIRRLPGLLSLRSREAHPLAFAAAMASFQFIRELKDSVEGGGAEAQPELAAAAARLSSEQMSDWLKTLARFYGAHSAGITALEGYHLYSHIGRGPGRYGARIRLPHTHALAFTVEMRNIPLQQGPGAAAVMESAREYADAARIAVQLAACLRLIGASARAHIDENYRVLCPLVARDAGLGEIGRFGYLITPDLGPRVRLAVVTTDLKLQPDRYLPDAAVIDFCSFCTKCADNCPAGAVPTGERVRSNGALRWKIDADACFRYWNSVGTDCGRCMATCPYSHLPLASPAWVRRLLRRSGFARRAFLALDDCLYGRRPAPHPGLRL
jgi:ferredoxin